MLFQIMAILATIYVGMIILADKWRKEEKEKPLISFSSFIILLLRQHLTHRGTQFPCRDCSP